MNKKIYIVVGETGRYPGDDYTWNVCAFLSKEEAEKRLELVQKEADRIVEEANPSSCYEDNIYDEYMLIIDDVVNYSIDEIELVV